MCLIFETSLITRISVLFSKFLEVLTGNHVKIIRGSIWAKQKSCHPHRVFWPLKNFSASAHFLAHFDAKIASTSLLAIFHLYARLLLYMNNFSRNASLCWPFERTLFQSFFQPLDLFFNWRFLGLLVHSLPLESRFLHGLPVPYPLSYASYTF